METTVPGDERTQDLTFMRMALEAAARAPAVGEVPIAALIVQRDAIRGELVGSDEALLEAAAAFRSGNLDHRSYVDFIMARLNKQVQLIAIEQSLLEQQIAIAGLTGAGLPSIESPPKETMP